MKKLNILHYAVSLRSKLTLQKKHQGLKKVYKLDKKEGNE